MIFTTWAGRPVGRPATTTAFEYSSARFSFVYRGRGGYLKKVHLCVIKELVEKAFQKGDMP